MVPENTRQPNNSMVCSEEVLPENKKEKRKKGGKILNLFSFELGLVGGKLMLILCPV